LTDFLAAETLKSTFLILLHLVAMIHRTFPLWIWRTAQRDAICKRHVISRATRDAIL
jgi:hypothetical protein